MTFSFYDELVGIAPLRVLEPISSLNLTPFALRAARSTGARTVGELAALLFDRPKECRQLGQGHLDEIQRALDQFIGRPPYPRDHRIDLASILRIGLSRADPAERSTLYLNLGLQNIFSLSMQEVREAEALLIRGKQQRIEAIIDRLKTGYSQELRELAALIFEGRVRPWLDQRNGLIHRNELDAFLFEAGTIGDYPTFASTMGLLLILTDQPILFSDRLIHVEGQLFASSETVRQWAVALLHDARLLIRSTHTHLPDLAAAVGRCRFLEWAPCPAERIASVLFWHFCPDDHLGPQ